MSYDYSNLVNVYYDEARRSFAQGCSFATIAMCWAAVERAIEHELRGGSIVDDKGRIGRQSVEFDSKQAPAKIGALLVLFPSLEVFRERLLALYWMRNCFCHARLLEIQEEVNCGSETQIANASLITLKDSAKHSTRQRLLGIKFLVAEAENTPIFPKDSSMIDIGKENDLIGAAHNAAQECLQITEDFLNVLMDAIRARR